MEIEIEMKMHCLCTHSVRLVLSWMKGKEITTTTGSGSEELTMMGCSPSSRFAGSKLIFGTAMLTPLSHWVAVSSVLNPLVSGYRSLWKSR